jgi:hypothetical protein
MAYKQIPELLFNNTVAAATDLLIIEQDQTRKITPLVFLNQSIPQLPTTTSLNSVDTVSIAQNKGGKLITVPDLLSKGIPFLTITPSVVKTNSLPIDDGTLAKRVTVFNLLTKGIPTLDTTTSVVKTNSLSIDDGTLAKRVTVFNLLTKGIPTLDITTTVTKTNYIPIDDGTLEQRVTVFNLFSKGIPSLDLTTTVNPTNTLPLDDGALAKRVTVTDFLSKGIPEISTTTTVEKTNSLPLDNGSLAQRATVFDFLTKGIPFLDNTTVLDRTNNLPINQAGTEKGISVVDFLTQGIPYLSATKYISEYDSLPLNQAGTERNANVVDFLTQTIPQLSSTTSVNKTDYVTLSNNLTAKNVTVLNFLAKGLPQLNTATTLLSSDLVPVGQDNKTFSRNTTIDKVNTYVHTHAPKISQCFYVGKHGVDADDFDERGKNVQLPYASIKYAAMKVAKAKVADTYPKQYTIFVATGIYNEDNPIYLPPNTSLIGDNLRRTVITPWHETYDVLWVNSGCYIWGFTFGDHIRNHTHPSAAVAFPLNIENSKKSDRFRSDFDNTSAFNIAFNNNYTGTMVLSSRPYISLSPYTQGCTSYANSSNMDDVTINDAGCGIRIDGSLVDGPIRSMVMDSFTQVNQGGIGVHVINHGYASLVSIFTICTTEGVLCEDGGTCSISTSNSTFGLSGLVARGKSLYPILTAKLVDFRYLDNFLQISEVGSAIKSLEDNQIIATSPYAGLTFTIGDNSGEEPFLVGDYPTTQTIIDRNAIKNFFITTTPEKINETNYIIRLDENLPINLENVNGKNFRNKTVKFYLRSQASTGSHTFEYIGTGTRILSSVPSRNGVANNSNEVVFDGLVDPNAPGIVYYTSTNELGNFRVGPDFTVVQSTGTIQGDTFNRSILTLVTPLNIALE